MSETESYWYAKFWVDKETPEFNKWWLDSYGPLSQFSDEPDNDDTDEYFRRKGFALMGWLARET